MGNPLKVQVDWVLIAAVVILVSFGLMMVYSSSYVFAYDMELGTFYFFYQQLKWIGISVGLFIFFMMFPFRYYQKLTPLIVLVSIILLILVLTPWFGVNVKGAQRWVDFGPIRLQPSEFVKIWMIIYLAHVYSRKQKYINQFVKGLLPPLIVISIIFALIMKQPDLGTAAVILLVAGLILFCAGARFFHIIILGSLASFIVIFYAVSEDYRLARITGFLNPFADASDSGYQLIQSYVAIAHGGLSGTGFGQSVQKLLYLPEAHTDFILAIISEELGLFGVLLVFACLGTIIFRGILIGTKCKNPFGSLLAFGISFQIAIQVCLNVGAVSGVLPITGIPLPLVSYGGSSLMITAISLGILTNIARYNSKQKNETELFEVS